MSGLVTVDCTYTTRLSSAPQCARYDCNSLKELEKDLALSVPRNVVSKRRHKTYTFAIICTKIPKCPPSTDGKHKVQPPRRGSNYHLFVVTVVSGEGDRTDLTSFRTGNRKWLV